MISQYTGGYSNPSSDIQNIIANKVSLLDSYILMQTGDNQYKAIVFNNASNKGVEYSFSRGSGTGYNNVYYVSEQPVTEMEYTVNNEFYVYSNVGVGKSLSLPIYQAVSSWAMVILCCLAMFAVIFKGALFKCLKRR